MAHEKNCILRNICKNAGVVGTCSDRCDYYVVMHGGGGMSTLADMHTDYKLTTIKDSPAYQERRIKLGGQEQTLKSFVDDYVTTFPRQFDTHGRQVSSLYLFSENTGTGKTEIACAIGNEFIKANYFGAHKRGLKPHMRPVYFLNFNSLQKHYNKANRRNSTGSAAELASDEYYKQLDIADDVPLLIIDEIGLREPTAGFRGDVQDLINYRTANRLPTLYTSNVPIEELAEMYDDSDSPRFMDRVRDMCVVIEVLGESARGLRVKGRRRGGTEI